MLGSRHERFVVGAGPSVTGLLALAGVALAALPGCSDSPTSAGAPPAAGTIAGAPSAGGNAAVSPASEPAPSAAAVVDTSEVLPTPSLQMPAPSAADPGAASTYVQVPITPPVSDAASPLPVARADGYTTEPNVIYGPLPEQHLDVLYPPSGGPTGTDILPGVILFHGDEASEGNKAAITDFYTRFLAHGFVVATAEYRDASRAVAPAAVEDALIAAKWFWDHLDYYHVDPAKYVAAGSSAGGHLALMVGMATAAANLGPVSPANFKIAAVVNAYGPADVTDMLERPSYFGQAWLPADTPERAALAAQLSPVTYVRGGLPPLLTIQGANDTTVPVAEGQRLDELLKAAGVDAQNHLVPGARHGFTTPRTSWPDAEKNIFAFLVAHGIGK